MCHVADCFLFLKAIGPPLMLRVLNLEIKIEVFYLRDPIVVHVGHGKLNHTHRHRYMCI